MLSRSVRPRCQACSYFTHEYLHPHTFATDKVCHQGYGKDTCRDQSSLALGVVQRSCTARAMIRARSCVSTSCTRFSQMCAYNYSCWSASSVKIGGEPRRRSHTTACVAQHERSSTADTLSAIEASIGNLSRSSMVRAPYRHVGAICHQEHSFQICVVCTSRIRGTPCMVRATHATDALCGNGRQRSPIGHHRRWPLPSLSRW